LKLHQKYFIAILKKLYLTLQKKVFINENIKYCIWHFKRALEIKKKKKKKKKKLCGNKVEKIKDLIYLL